jgi:hypothetical protein
MRRVWVSKWALTYGIFEIETEDAGPCITFIHPWTGRECVATGGDWHEDRWAALRQAEHKRHGEMRLLVSRMGALNDLAIQEYEIHDFNNGKRPIRTPSESYLKLKRDLARPGMEEHWGDSELS